MTSLLVLNSLAMLAALVIDRLIGWPDTVYQRIGHPVVWFGRVISTLDQRLNLECWSARRRRWHGRLTVLVLCGLALLVTVPLTFGIIGLWDSGYPLVAVGCQALLVWPWLAARSLVDHVRRVADPLTAGDLPAARASVAMIVGRDPMLLDSAGVARAAVESLAENCSDGVTAPWFWGLVLGLPGIAVYKAINTMDSMIGHKTPRLIDFGRAAALLDDRVNWPASRLTGAVAVLCSGRPLEAGRAVVRDARKHRSPNAGWPEAAWAGGLGLRLSGPRVYDGKISAEPWVNEGGSDPDGPAISRAIGLFNRVWLVLAGLTALVAALAAG